MPCGGIDRHFGTCPLPPSGRHGASWAVSHCTPAGAKCKPRSAQRVNGAVCGDWGSKDRDRLLAPKDLSCNRCSCNPFNGLYCSQYYGCNCMSRKLPFAKLTSLSSNLITWWPCPLASKPEPHRYAVALCTLYFGSKYQLAL
jgi:hypothetical protein